MRQHSTRRFGIIDGMGIVAAAAVAFALARYHLGRIPIAERPGMAFVHAARSVALPLSWMVAALSLVGRGPGRRRPMPPGVAAGVGVIVATCISLSIWVHTVVTSMPGGGWAWAELPWEFIPQGIIDPTPPAIAVGSVWAVLALDRRWRPEPAWLDQLGRILGAYWLADAVGLPIVLRVAGYW
jgi:hypothetical protein